MEGLREFRRIDGFKPCRQSLAQKVTAIDAEHAIGLGSPDEDIRCIGGFDPHEVTQRKACVVRSAHCLILLLFLFCDRWLPCSRVRQEGE